MIIQAHDILLLLADNFKRVNSSLFMHIYRKFVKLFPLFKCKERFPRSKKIHVYSVATCTYNNISKIERIE